MKALAWLAQYRATLRTCVRRLHRRSIDPLVEAVPMEEMLIFCQEGVLASDILRAVEIGNADGAGSPLSRKQHGEPAECR